MKVRRFYLENEKGQSIDMNSLKEGCFFSSPAGLGYAYKSEFEQLGNTFVENDKQLSQKEISGTIHFSSYDRFKQFVDFVESSEKLKIKYVVPYLSGEKEYYKDISIKDFQKKEIHIKMLSCPIVFYCLSLWYEQTTAIYTIEPLENEIRWDFRWDSKFTDYNTRALTYINKGHTEASILVEMSGKIVSPYIELYVEGELYQSVTVNATIEEYEKLLYGTKENEFYIYKQHTDGTLESLFNLDVIDFSNDNIIRLPQNKSCEIKLRAQNEVLNAQLTILTYYKAV